jgi:hypothetical protein
MNTPPFQGRPPENDHITPYDEQHFVTYLQLLDAQAAGVDWREIVRVVFGLDPQRSSRARSIYETHLARARWMTEKGYRELLSK